LHIFYNLLVYASRTTTTKAGGGKQDICQWLVDQVTIKPTGPIKQRLKKFKNQRPPAEVAPASSRGHPHTPSSAGGR